MRQLARYCIGGTADELREPLRQNGAGETGCARERLHGPVALRLAMQCGDRDADARIAQTRQPIRASGVERFGVAAHDLDEQQLAQAAEHALAADSRSLRLCERELHVRASVPRRSP